MNITTITATFNNSVIGNNVTSIAQVLSYTFLLPYVSIGLLLLVYGISWVATKRIQIAGTSGLITSLIIYYLAPAIMPQSYILYTFGIWIITLGAELFIGNSKKHTADISHHHFNQVKK